MANKSIKLKVESPNEVLFQGDVYAISSKNTAGPFDILPQHASFISLIDKEPITIQKLDGQKLTFKFNQAIIYFTTDTATIFADPTSTKGL